MCSVGIMGTTDKLELNNQRQLAAYERRPSSSSGAILAEFEVEVVTYLVQKRGLTPVD